MRYVLFVCTHNAGRSQMAEAFFNRAAPPDLRAESAGESPAPFAPTVPLGRGRRIASWPGW
jgi:protein-tyrosine-phosphatase